MFPLGSVLFPYAVLPLHVFEPRYRVMTRHCLDTDREFGVVLIERGSEVGGGDVRFDLGTIARIVHVAELDDGRFALATVGLRRIRVLRWLADDPYPQAEVEPIGDDADAAPDVAPERDAVAAALAGVLALWQRLDPRVTVAPPEPTGDPVRDRWELAAASPLGPLDAQRVLAAPGALARARVLRELLAERAEDLRGRLALE
jgi:Lon protease-like protein